MRGYKKGAQPPLSKGGTPITPRRQKFKDLLAAKRDVVARAVMFELACQAAKESNTRDAEDAMTRALDALGNATKKLMRIQKRRA